MSLLQEKTARKGTVSRIYKLLVQAEQGTQVLKMQWQDDLDKEVIGEEWDKIWDQGIMKNMSVRIKENCYKVKWRWYLMLVKLKIIIKKGIITMLEV